MLPLATTTITVDRKTEPEPYEEVSWVPVAAGVPAHISAPSGSERMAGGGAEIITDRLAADLDDLRNGDRVVDAEGRVFSVVWASRRVGLGLGHMAAGLRRVDGRVPA